MKQLILNFQIEGTPISAELYGHGHINETYRVITTSGRDYILQKLNLQVFRSPKELMENIDAVTRHLSTKNPDPRSALHIVPNVNGKPYYVDEAGNYWRVYDFIFSTICLQQAGSPKDLYNSGLAFGRFQRLLSDFPAEKLHESIPNFHNTKIRFQQLHQAIETNYDNRLSGCREIVEFALAQEAEAGILVDQLEQGLLPLRVTHNDTKLNNILFDQDTREPLCVIDLDTVMPGSSLYDYGDAIRFGASSAVEDEQDLSKVWCDMELFRAYTSGFLRGCEGSLTPLEIELLPMGAKIMTLECGIRFLADHLNGDTYFRIHRPGHNLDRAGTQMKLVADMEAKWDTMHQIVAEATA